MNPAGAAVYIILFIIIALAVFGTVKRIRHDSSCCGEHEAAPKKIRVADKYPGHYQYTYELLVDGMHCSNCARRIENAFNSNIGLWTRASIGERKVFLKAKSQIRDEDLRRIVSEAGYTLLSIKHL